MKTMKECLRDLLDRFEEIQRTHREITDTAVRDETTEAVLGGFYLDNADYRVPARLAMFEQAGNKLVQAALTDFLRDVREAARHEGCETYAQRVRALQTGEEYKSGRFGLYLHRVDEEEPAPPEESHLAGAERLMELYGKRRDADENVLKARCALALSRVKGDGNVRLTKKMERESKAVADCHDERYRLELEIANLEARLSVKGDPVPYRHTHREVLAFLRDTSRLLEQEIDPDHLVCVRLKALDDMLQTLG